eukprot:12249482-Alexandrium_andersonii.AAC.1
MIQLQAWPLEGKRLTRATRALATFPAPKRPQPMFVVRRGIPALRIRLDASDSSSGVGCRRCVCV